MQPVMEKNQFNLNGMKREELNDLLEEVMIRLRQLDSNDLQREIITKSQRLYLERPK